MRVLLNNAIQDPMTAAMNNVSQYTYTSVYKDMHMCVHVHHVHVHVCVHVHGVCHSLSSHVFPEPCEPCMGAPAHLDYCS